MSDCWSGSKSFFIHTWQLAQNGVPAADGDPYWGHNTDGSCPDGLGSGQGHGDKVLVQTRCGGRFPEMRTGWVGSSGSYLRVRLGESMAGAVAWPSSTCAGMAASAGAIAASRSISLLETKIRPAYCFPPSSEAPSQGPQRAQPMDNWAATAVSSEVAASWHQAISRGACHNVPGVHRSGNGPPVHICFPCSGRKRRSLSPCLDPNGRASPDRCTAVVC